MSDEYNQSGVCSTNWWESRSSPTSSSSNLSHLNTIASFGWSPPALPSDSTDPSFQIMGLGLPPQTQLDWNPNPSLLGGRTMLEEEMNPPSGFSFSLLEHHDFDSHSSSSGIDESQYGNTPPDMLHGLMGSSENHPGYDYNNPYQEGYTMVNTYAKFSPQFITNHDSAPTKQILQFSNNASYGFDSELQDGFSLKTPGSTIFDEKQRERTRDSSGRKSGCEPGFKRTRSDPPGSLPGGFKVRKEKMGDKITALQQLVSPFGKTDTASVLSEAIEYIKCLHHQVSTFSSACMNTSTGAHPFQQHQGSSEKSRDSDLRSRGLCLMPVSSTFQVVHETTSDFWPPTFGGTYR